MGGLYFLRCKSVRCEFKKDEWTKTLVDCSTGVLSLLLFMLPFETTPIQATDSL